MTGYRSSRGFVPFVGVGVPGTRFRPEERPTAHVRNEQGQLTLNPFYREVFHYVTSSDVARQIAESGQLVVHDNREDSINWGGEIPLFSRPGANFTDIEPHSGVHAIAGGTFRSPYEVQYGLRIRVRGDQLIQPDPICAPHIYRVCARPGEGVPVIVDRIEPVRG